ncbi:PAK3 kinase, partial [Nesospiza acunhae]|nr:PAK3 kinase [Nesospiza acunhae]
VAIKKINLKGLKKKKLKVNELMVLKINRNPNLINYLDSFLLGDELWLVMEYMDGGPLSDIIGKTCLSEDHIAAISQECLQGLDFLHSNHIIYRDVKSCNILLRTNGSVKLGQYILGQVQCSRDVGLLGVTASSPEMVLVAVQGHLLAVTDVKAAGGASCFLCRQAQLLTARGERPQLRQPNRFSSCLCDFLSCCLQTDVKCRWSAKELLQHPFVRSAKPASSLAPLINSIKKKKKK